MNKEVIWKNILYPHAYVGHIDKMSSLAEQVGYKFFAWNGRIHFSANQEYTGVDTCDIEIQKEQ